MITSVLLMMIAASCLIQPNAPRLFAAAVFAGLTLTHEFSLSHLEGLEYYGSAALVDLGIMIAMSGISPTPAMVINLQRICIASIVTNFLGWVMWLTYLPPIAYNYAYVFIYIVAFAVLIKRDKGDVGGFAMDSWGACFRVNIFARIDGSGESGGKT